MKFKNIIIIGLGLIGGSLAKSCKKKNIVEKILAFDINEDSLIRAFKSNIINERFNFSQKIPNQSLIVISSPLKTYQEIFSKLKSIIADDTIIIDFGSVKQRPTKIADKILMEKAGQFIPCHPIAGSEKCGIENANEHLFNQKSIHIYKNKENKILRNFLQEVGFIPSVFLKNKTELEKHDKKYSALSHLPQLISFLLAENIKTKNKELLRHLRLQGSSKNLWEDIFVFNAKFLLKDLKKFQKYLIKILEDLENNKEIIAPNRNKKVKILEDFDDLNMMYIFLIKSMIIIKIENSLDDETLKSTGFEDFTCISIYNSYIIKTLRENPEKFDKNKIIKKLEEYIKICHNYIFLHRKHLKIAINSTFRSL